MSNVNKDDKLIIKKGITVPNNKDLCRLKEITNLLISHLKRNYLIKPKEVVEYINRNDIKYSTESNTISKIIVTNKTEVLHILKAVFRIKKKSKRKNTTTEMGYILLNAKNNPYFDIKTNKENYKLSETFTDRAYILSTYIK